MRALHAFSCGFAGCVVGWVCAPTHASSRTIPVEHAVEVMRNLEQRYDNIAWRFHTYSAELGDASVPDSITRKRAEFSRGWSRFDAVGRRYACEVEYTARWFQGAAPYISGVEAFSFDGDLHRHWERTQHGTKIPTDSSPKIPASGWIAKEEQGQPFMESFAGNVGIGNMPPMIWIGDLGPPRPLSEHLQERLVTGVPIEVLETDDGLWKVETTTLDSAGLRPPSNVIRLVYDLKRGGIVTQVLLAGAVPEEAAQRVSIKFREVEEGVWVPKQADKVFPYNKPPTLFRTIYEDVRVNPPATPADFRIEFPAGVFVDDYVKQRSYTVGAGMENEPAAIRRFMESHGLDPPDDPESARGDVRRWLVIGGNAVFLAAVLIWLWVRKRRKRPAVSPTTGVVALACILSATSASAGDALRYSDDVVISHAPEENIRVAQCGFHVAVLALEWFDVDYDAPAVSKGLLANEDGVSVADLQAVLRAYGLNARARRDVKVADLVESLNSKRLAVLPLRMRKDANHYFVAMLNRRGKPVLVNVLHGVDPIQQALNDSWLAKTDGLGLFIERMEKSEKEADVQSIQISPEQVELGSFKVPSKLYEGRITRTVTVRNTGKEPVLVTAVNSSCGCSKPEWRGGIIRPDQDQVINVNVRPRAWGTGAKTKVIRLSYADGTSSSVNITGEGLAAEDVHELRVARDEVRIEVERTNAVWPEEVLTRISVDGGDKGLGDVRLAATSDSITAAFEKNGKENERILIKVALNEDLQQRLETDSQVAVGRVEVSRGEQDGGPVSVPVILVARRTLSVDPNLTMLKSSAEAFVDVSSREGAKLEFKSFTIAPEDPGIQVTEAASDGGVVRLGVRNTSATMKGYFVVRCRFSQRESPTSSNFASFVVRLTP